MLSDKTMFFNIPYHKKSLHSKKIYFAVKVQSPLSNYSDRFSGETSISTVNNSKHFITFTSII